MTFAVPTVVVLIVVASPAFGPPVSPASVVTQAGASVSARDVPLLRLASVGRLFTELAEQRTSGDEGERVAAWTEFAVLVEAVVGEGRVTRLAFEELAASPTTAHGLHVVAEPGVAARDALAYRLLALGYSARETADVVSGRIGKRALDTARKMLLAGRGREVAANYLDSQYRRLALALKAPGEPSGTMTRGAEGSFEAAIEKYARLHNVEASLVRAIIATESGFNQAARSRAGAIGLMQLMPATARALGVDPLMPEENIEGGVRYLSELLKMFGGIELALVAYNGGPGYARRYARGEAVLYGETRGYVQQVLARIRAPR